MFKLHVRMPDEMMHCSIIPLVFQPIVENSINHGFQDYDQPLNIVIEGEWTEEGEILIRVTDDGAGMSTEKRTELSALLENAETDKYKLEDVGEADGNGNGNGNGIGHKAWFSSGCAIVPLTNRPESAITDIPIDSYVAKAAEQIATGDEAAIGRLIGRLEQAKEWCNPLRSKHCFPISLLAEIPTPALM